MRLSQAPAPAESLLSQVRSALSLDDQVCADLLDGTEDLEPLQGLSLDAVRRRPAQLRAMQVGLEAQLLGLASGPGTSGFVEAAECAGRSLHQAVSESAQFESNAQSAIAEGFLSLIHI